MKDWQKDYLERVSESKSKNENKKLIIQSYAKELMPYIIEYKALSKYSKDDKPLFDSSGYNPHDICIFINTLQKHGHFDNLTVTSFNIYKCKLTGVTFSSYDLLGGIEEINKKEVSNIFIVVPIIAFILFCYTISNLFLS